MEYEHVGDKWEGNYIGLFYAYTKKQGYLEGLRQTMEMGCQVVDDELFIRFGELRFEEYKKGDEHGLQAIVITIIKYGSREDFIQAIELGIEEIRNIWRQQGFRITK